LPSRLFSNNIGARRIGRVSDERLMPRALPGLIRYDTFSHLAMSVNYS
jgi:hypothetical protein